MIPAFPLFVFNEYLQKKFLFGSHEVQERFFVEEAIIVVDVMLKPQAYIVEQSYRYRRF